MKDEYVTREEFKKAQEEIDMRFNALHATTNKTARELDEIYSHVRDWMNQQFQMLLKELHKHIANIFKKIRKIQILLNKTE